MKKWIIFLLAALVVFVANTGFTARGSTYPNPYAATYSPPSPRVTTDATNEPIAVQNAPPVVVLDESAQNVNSVNQTVQNTRVEIKGSQEVAPSADLVGNLAALYSPMHDATTIGAVNMDNKEPIILTSYKAEVAYVTIGNIPEDVDSPDGEGGNMLQTIEIMGSPAYSSS